MNYCFNPVCNNTVAEGKLFCAACEKEIGVNFNDGRATEIFSIPFKDFKRIQRKRKFETVLRKIKYWLFVRNKGCRHACPFCEYYDLCRAEIEAERSK